MTYDELKNIWDNMKKENKGYYIHKENKTKDDIAFENFVNYGLDILWDKEKVKLNLKRHWLN